MSVADRLEKIKKALPKGVALIAVSKTQPIGAIQAALRAGQRRFGENKVQELTEKAQRLRGENIEWHMIGHLQRNKVKYIAPFVDLIHSVDSFRLLCEIDAQAVKNNRIIPVLLQIKIAEESSKFGLSELEALDILKCDQTRSLKNIEIRGLMGMATLTDEPSKIRREFNRLKDFFTRLKKDYKPAIDTEKLTELSMGMSGDYKLAIRCGSTTVRIGSAIFGPRNPGPRQTR